jgi:antitoxin component YwqK of YwqJK toxin-antitoxin module
MNVIKEGSNMKYRIGFVTNSSSSSYVFVKIKTNSRIIEIDNDFPGDPGDSSFERLGGWREFSDYSQVLRYIILVKLRELSKENRNILDVDGNGDYYFSEEDFPTNPNDDEKLIKYLVDLDRSTDNISTLENFTNHSIWKIVFGFSDGEFAEEVLETHQISDNLGTQPISNTTVCLRDLAISVEEDYSELISNEFDNYNCGLDSWEFAEYSLLHDYVDKIRSDNIESIQDTLYFHKEIILELSEQVTGMNDEFKKKLQESIRVFNIDINEYEIDGSLNQIFNDIHIELIEKAINQKVNIRNIIVNAFEKTNDRLEISRNFSYRVLSKDRFNNMNVEEIDYQGVIRYVGEWRDGKRHGQGTLYYQNGAIKYYGKWQDGKQHGQGTSYNYNGNIDYQGNWKDSAPHGQGTLFYFNGKVLYQGKWIDGKPNSYGTFYNENGSIIYQGEFMDGEFHGQGTQYYEKGTVEYQGEWMEGKSHGQGTQYYEKGTVEYQGEWMDGEFHGHGTKYFENGSIDFQGEWIDGKPNAQEKTQANNQTRVVETKKLAFKEGSSDKVYHVFLIKVENGFFVNFEFGKRGTKLQTGTKTTTPIDEVTARKIFNKTVQEKTSKGYYEEK